MTTTPKAAATLEVERTFVEAKAEAPVTSPPQVADATEDDVNSSEEEDARVLDRLDGGITDSAHDSDDYMSFDDLSDDHVKEEIAAATRHSPGGGVQNTPRLGSSTDPAPEDAADVEKSPPAATIPGTCAGGQDLVDATEALADAEKGPPAATISGTCAGGQGLVDATEAGADAEKGPPAAIILGTCAGGQGLVEAPVGTTNVSGISNGSASTHRPPPL